MAEEPTAPGQGNNTAGRTSLRRLAFEYAKAAVVTLLLALVLKTFVIEAYRIPSGSMEQTLLPGDFLIVNKLIYGIHTPHTIPFTSIRLKSYSLPPFRSIRRGDVFVFEFPGHQGQTLITDPTHYIKRCIGLPRDTVELRDGRLFVNGAELPLPPHAIPPTAGRFTDWNRTRIFPPGSGFTENDYGPLVIPYRGMTVHLTKENFYQWDTFIIREGSDASIEDDTIRIDGRPQTEYTVRRDYYFGIGDNRDNSLDSRHWGFIPDENVTGEALVIYWSWDVDLESTGFWDRLKTLRWDRIGTLIR